jgi:hypothetical protein
LRRVAREGYSICVGRGVENDVKVELDRFAITELVGAGGYFATVDDVLNAYNKRTQ